MQFTHWFMKQAKNTMQDKLETQIRVTANIDTIATLFETPSDYYQQSSLLVPLLTILCKHIPHKHKIDTLLQNFSIKVLHTYNLPINAIDFEKVYQQSLRLKDINVYVTRNQLFPSVPAQRRIKSWHAELIVINKFLFHINSCESVHR